MIKFWVYFKDRAIRIFRFCTRCEREMLRTQLLRPKKKDSRKSKLIKEAGL